MNKSFFLFLSIISFSLFSQTETSIKAKPFDEQKVIAEAKAKGIPAGDISGYVSSVKSKYLSRYKTENKKNFSIGNNTRQNSQAIATNSCANTDFSFMNYSSWTGDISDSITSGGVQFPNAFYWGTGIQGNNGVPICMNTDPSNLSIAPNARQTIMSIPIGAMTANPSLAFSNGYDPVCQNPNTGLFDLPMIPGPGQTCLRMGSLNAQYTSEEMVYSFTPNSSTPLFTFKYAIVISDGGHSIGDQPAFVITLKDQAGNPLGGSCGLFIPTLDTPFVKSTSPAATGFSTAPVYYCQWRTQSIDLSSYYGSTVNIEFQTLDCAYSGHFCYAYISATCDPNILKTNMCASSTTQQIIAPSGYASYQWYDPSNNPISGPNGTNDTLVITNGNVGDVYHLDFVTTQSCTATTTVYDTLQYSQLQIQYSSSISGGFSGNGNIILCDGGSINLSASGAITYTWSANTGGSNVNSINIPNSIGTYSVAATDNTGCVFTSVFNVIRDSACVWPGDADENLQVDNQDLLPIGLNFWKTGPPRNILTMAWQGFPCNDWADTLANGKNMKYADCSGDGIISIIDTLGVNYNYSLTHLYRMELPHIKQTINPDVYLQFNKSLYHAGDTLLADVMMGWNSMPLNNFYGAAFSIDYDEPQVKPGSEQFYFNNSWVGNINVDQIKFSKIFPVSGYVDASLVRITHTNQNGFGKIAQLKLILKDTVTANWLYFTTSNAIKTDNAGINNSLNSGTDSVAVVAGVGVKQFVNNVNHIIVFPNPSAGSFAVNCSKNIDEIKITDILGNIIYSTKPNAQKVNLQIEEAGVYFVTITNGKESTVRKVIVNR